MLKLEKQELSDEDKKRYIRHLNLSLVKEKGQQRIMSARILFVGAGGLASSSLLYLAAAGIKNIGIVDYDSVDISNLQRQIIHSEKSLGVLKAKSARQSIRKLNKNCQVKVYYCKLNSYNALKITKHYDIVIDCTDNINTRNTLNGVCSLLNLPYAYAAISQFTGHVSLFYFQNNLSYNDIVSSNDNIDDCNNNGVLSLLPGIIGLFQGNEIIKIILGIPPSLNKNMLVYDALQLDFYKMKIIKQKSNLSIRRYLNNNQYDKSKDCYLNSMQKILLSNDLIIDIRDSYSAKMRPIEKSIKIPINKLINDTSIDFIKEKSINHTIYIYCDSLSKTNLAIKLLKNNSIHCSKYCHNVNSYR